MRWSIFISFFLLPAFPKVQVYTQTPGEVGKANMLMCHITGFHPPQISIDLLRNGHILSGGLQTDLVFEGNWLYRLTKYVSFTPAEGDTYACRVTHMGKSRTFSLGRFLSIRRKELSITCDGPWTDSCFCLQNLTYERVHAISSR